ncbi:hypothetical protein ACFWAE_24410, partial [Priestia megaterium]|uniref:hypothetical protein n=1 Tax=Priestia megaterium TaxID=1404 RepID=UPI0036727AE7
RQIIYLFFAFDYKKCNTKTFLFFSNLKKNFVILLILDKRTNRKACFEKIDQNRLFINMTD